VGDRPFAAVPGPFGFDLYVAGIAGEIVAEAAPWPVFGVFDEASVDRVTVKVAELFDVLPVSEDVEVIVAGLPEVLAVALETFGSFAFEDAHGIAQELEPWFGHQQVDVFGHDDVAEEIETVSEAVRSRISSKVARAWSLFRSGARW
jgi:hypothetical protein